MNTSICPKCNSKDICDVVYGMSDVEVKFGSDIESDDVYFGGCIVDDGSPQYHCNTCQANFDVATTNIYLDIDGVILANNLNPANHAAEFLQYVLTNYPDSTYWLTTHCQGDANIPIQHIGHLFNAETVELMKKIKPTSWDTAKTRAIDFSKPFVWFDDDLFYEEKQTLIANEALDNWIEVDLSKNPNKLADFITSFPLPSNVKHSSD